MFVLLSPKQNHKSRTEEITQSLLDEHHLKIKEAKKKKKSKRASNHIYAISKKRPQIRSSILISSF